MARGFRARGRCVMRIRSGTMTVRDQYETLLRWNGNPRGSNMISTGISGTERHGTWPNSAKVMRVHTLERAAPPRVSIASRARRMCGADGASPANFSAKYALTEQLTSTSPS